MKLKKGLEDSTGEFWYDLIEGYLNPKKMLENEEDIKKVLEAIAVLKDFEKSCEDQIKDFIQ